MAISGNRADRVQTVPTDRAEILADLYPSMMAARADAVRMGNNILTDGCADPSRKCVAELMGNACDAVSLWLDATNRYDGLRDEWVAAGRPE